MSAGINIRTNELGRPRWCADFLSRDHLVPVPAKIDPNAFRDYNAVTVKLNGNVSADAVALVVDPLTAPIPAGANLYFGESKELVRVTADAVVGATSITVQAVPTAMEDNDEAYYQQVQNRKYLPSGLLVGRTYAERDASTPYGVGDDTDDQLFLTAFEVWDAEQNNDIELVRHGTVIKENYLPEWATISADANLLAALRAAYVCIKGKD